MPATPKSRRPEFVTKRLIRDYLEENSPLYESIKNLQPSLTERIIDQITENIGLGRNPRVTAQNIADLLGTGLADAVRWARTTQMEVYRETNSETMRANENILDGWYWFAQLDDNTCEVCREEHGTFHELDEDLDGHWNCRCTQIPHVRGDDPPGFAKG